MNVLKEEVVKGSFVLFIMMNIFNFLNYIFHFSMARLLTTEDYGILAVLMSIVYIFGVPAEAVQTIVSRYTSKFNVKKEYGKIKNLLIISIKKVTLFSFILFLFYIPISFFISRFTSIPISLIIFTGVLLFGILLVPVMRGVLQGTKQFKLLGYNLIIESVIKVLLAVGLVLLGFKVYGAIGAVILGVCFVLVFSFFMLKKITKVKMTKADVSGIYSYSFPVFLVMLTIMIMASLDIIFVKSYFSSEIAGEYAVASMLGKMIFFGTFAIGKAMFPLTSEQHEKGEKTRGIFKKSFLIVLGLCVLAVLAFFFLPKLIISVLFGSRYLAVSGILGFVAIAYSLLSLSNISLIYSLSMRNKKVSLFVVFILLEIISFILFHSSLKEFVLGFTAANFIMFIFSLLFVKNKK